MAKLRILVVDDIYTNRYLLTELVKITGNEVIQAENGEEAIRILEDDKIDLIFMDIEMPIMNGIETTMHIRNKMPFPINALPIIALTAHNPNLFFKDFADVGFDELITKPYSVEKIKAKINGFASSK